MAKTSQEYWQKRFEAVEEMNHKTAKDAVNAVTPAFDSAQREIEKEITSWYQRFADNNEISLQEAKVMLNAKELKELKWDIDEYIKYGKENALDSKWMKELENASAKYHITRLEALKIRTQQAAEKAFGNELDVLDELAARIYTEDYYHTAYEIQKGLGIGWDIGQIDDRKLQNLLKKPWTADGKTFSNRIWTSKSQLLDSLHTELTQMCILGKAPDTTIKNIAARMNVSKNQAGRLIMTESAYFSSVAQKDCFNELNVEKFEIVATLDSHTSTICQQMDGQVFDMKDFEAGVTAPPFHVWCRTTTVPYFEDNDGTRAARDADGRTYYVPASMKYPDWKKTFVDNGLKDELKPVLTDAELIKQLNEKGTDVLLDAYEERRLKFNLNYTPASDLRGSDYNSVIVDYTGISPEVAETFNDTFFSLSEKYYTAVSKIEVGDAKEFFGSPTFVTTSHRNTIGDKVMTLNPIKMKDYDKMTERIKELSNKGYSVKIADENLDKYLATHEFAHGLINMEGSLKNYVDLDTKLYTNIRKEIKAVYNKYTSDVQKIVDEINDIKKNPVFKDFSDEATAKQFELFAQIDEKQKLLKKIKISDYSMENADEFFAEAFTQAQIGLEQSKYSDEIMEIVDKYFGKSTNSNLTSAVSNNTIKSVKDVADFDALSDYLDSTYGIKMNDAVKKLDFETVKESIEGVESVISEYPDVGTLLKEAITSNDGVMSCNGEKLTFNPNDFANKQNFIDECNKQSATGFWIPNSSPASMGAHEAAHGVEWVLIQSNPAYTYDFQKIMAWNDCSEAKAIVSQACKNIKKTSYGKGKSKKELIQNISRYALDTDSETMAEAFADVYANGSNANPLSVEIKKLTEERMKKHKGVV